MSLVIFNRPLRLGKKNYPKGKRPVEVPEADLKGSFVEAALEEGWLVVSAAPKAAAPAAPAKAK
jgi:hypothetical protein